MKILHITSHIGGGIGSAYLGLGNCGHEQTIMLLEQPINTNNIDRVKNAGIRVINADNAERELQLADIIVFSWYHHPLLAKFFYDFPQIPIRSILWCHVSGNYFPAIPCEFITKFDKTLFTTPFSLTLPNLTALGNDYIKSHLGLLYGLNDLSSYANIQRKSHEGFQIGYVGTLGFCKLNPHFVDFCAAVDYDEVCFKMIGTPSTQNEIMAVAAARGISERFDFCGQVNDVKPYLAEMDVFSYLLNPQHFGATENSLLEAMASGLPVIALDQCVEKHIIRDGITGLLVHTPEEYGKAVRYLMNNPDKAKKLGDTAQKEILDRYNIDANRKIFTASCEEVMQSDKHLFDLKSFLGNSPANWFLSCVEEDLICFKEDRPQDAGLIFKEPTKGSPRHYSSYFPADEKLKLWAAKLKSE